MDSLRELKILDRVGGHSLVKASSGYPDYATYSDHLPIVFKLEI